MINLESEIADFKKDFEGLSCDAYLIKEIDCHLGRIELKGAYYNIGCYLNGKRTGKKKLIAALAQS